MKWWHVILIVIALQFAEALVFGTVGAIALTARDKTTGGL